MSNLDLKLIPGSSGTLVILNSDFGEVASRVDNAFLATMEARSIDLRRHFHRGFSGSPHPTALVENLGEDLFNGIFQNDALHLFNKSIGGANQGQLNLRVMLGDARLNRIHWEVLRFKGEFLCFRHNLIRHPFVSRPIQIPFEKRKKLRVCAIAVDPLLGPQGIYHEYSSIIRLFQPFGQQIELIELYQQDATLDKILDVLFQGVDILHFSGHGYVDINNPSDSALVIWPDRADQRHNLLSVRTLVTLAHSQNLGFCFLNACDTARGSPPPSTSKDDGESSNTRDESFVNMAYSLMCAGVPLVVATNYEISVEAATILSNRFYTSIIKHGRRIDQAIRDARGELFVRRGHSVVESDWSCPTLYARSRQMVLGTEALRWAPTFDIYTLRNVRPPNTVDIAERVRAESADR